MCLWISRPAFDGGGGGGESAHGNEKQPAHNRTEQRFICGNSMRRYVSNKIITLIIMMTPEQYSTLNWVKSHAVFVKLLLYFC